MYVHCTLYVWGSTAVCTVPVLLPCAGRDRGAANMCSHCTRTYIYMQIMQVRTLMTYPPPPPPPIVQCVQADPCGGLLRVQK